eukprot:s148_g42.t1
MSASNISVSLSRKLRRGPLPLQLLHRALCAIGVEPLFGSAGTTTSTLLRAVRCWTFRGDMVPAGLVISGSALVVVRLSRGRQTFAGTFGPVTKTLPIGTVKYGIMYVRAVRALLFQLSWPNTSTESTLVCLFVDAVVDVLRLLDVWLAELSHVDVVLLVAEDVLLRALARLVGVPALLLAARLAELLNVDVVVLLAAEDVADASLLAMFIA